MSTSGRGPYQPTVSSCDERPKAQPLPRGGPDPVSAGSGDRAGVQGTSAPARGQRRRGYATPARSPSVAHSPRGTRAGGSRLIFLVGRPRRDTGPTGRCSVPDVSEEAPSGDVKIKAQVYKDPRPKEHFDRFHARDAHAAAGHRLRDRPHRHHALRLDALPRARHRRRAGPAQRAGDPRAQPLLVHGPLPHRRLDPAQGPVHGEVAALQAADAVHLHPRRRLPGAARPPRRRDVRHRAQGPRRRRLRRHVLRGRALAHRADRRDGAPGIGRLALESGATIVPIAVHGSSRVRNWRRLQFPTVTVQYGEPLRYERIDEPTRNQQRAVADAILEEIRDALRRARGGRARRRARAGARRAARRGAPSGPPRRDGVSRRGSAGMIRAVRRAIVLALAVAAVAALAPSAARPRP